MKQNHWLSKRSTSLKMSFLIENPLTVTHTSEVQTLPSNICAFSNSSLLLCAFGFALFNAFQLKKGIGSQPFVSSFHMSSISKPMSHFLRKSVLFGSCNHVNILAQTSIVCSLRVRRFSVSSDRKQSFAVSYLISSLGFSPKAALSASRFVKFDSPDKPEKTIDFFKGYGFTHAQISRLVKGHPQILVTSPEEILLPKLEFFVSKGISRPELVKAVSVFPIVLSCSLENRIIPTYEFIRDFFQSDEMAITMFRRCPDIVIQKIDRSLGPNIAILREHGVSYSNIAKLIRWQPRVIVTGSDKFRKVVEEVVEMGFDSSRNIFVVAVYVLQGLAKLTWESKVNAYKKWGWSDDEILQAFKTSPLCMMLSEDNIMETMDVFVNRMGLRPCVIAKNPTCLSHSVKKRIIPRLSVFEALLSKGLVEKEVNMRALLIVKENKFLKTFVEPYPKEAPELMKLYKKQLDISSTMEMDKVYEPRSRKLFGFVSSDQ